MGITRIPWATPDHGLPLAQPRTSARRGSISQHPHRAILNFPVTKRPASPSNTWNRFPQGKKKQRIWTIAWNIHFPHPTCSPQIHPSARAPICTGKTISLKMRDCWGLRAAARNGAILIFMDRRGRYLQRPSFDHNLLPLGLDARQGEQLRFEDHGRLLRVQLHAIELLFPPFHVHWWHKHTGHSGITSSKATEPPGVSNDSAEKQDKHTIQSYCRFSRPTLPNIFPKAKLNDVI